MKFTIAAPGSVLPPSPPQQPGLPRLKVRRGQTAPGIWEPVGAVTADGLWLFERAPDGTWRGGHLPSRTEVKDGLRSLLACRVYVVSGEAQGDLERIQAATGQEEPGE